MQKYALRIGPKVLGRVKYTIFELISSRHIRIQNMHLHVFPALVIKLYGIYCHLVYLKLFN